MTGLRIDREMIEARLAYLHEALVTLSRHQGKPLSDLQGDIELRWMAQHGLLMSLQVVLDVAAHLSAAVGAQAATDYRSSIIALGSLKVLPPELAFSLAPLASFRIVLVH